MPLWILSGLVPADIGEAGGRGGERTPVVSHRLDLLDVAYAQRAYSTLAYGELLEGSLVDFTA